MIFQLWVEKNEYNSKVYERENRFNKQMSIIQYKLINNHLNYLKASLEEISYYTQNNEKTRKHQLSSRWFLTDPDEYSLKKIIDSSSMIEFFSLNNLLCLYFGISLKASVSNEQGNSSALCPNSYQSKKNLFLSESQKFSESFYNFFCFTSKNFTICSAFSMNPNPKAFISEKLKSVWHNEPGSTILSSEYQIKKYLFSEEERSEFSKKYLKMLNQSSKFSTFKAHQKGKEM
jgi:hypothetical protein